MSSCPQCNTGLPADARWCPGCGAPLIAAGVDDAPERDLAPTATSAFGVSPPAAGSDPRGAGSRFIPGTVIAGRYRVVGLLGRGGMGEVYRADDLKLGQPVALKFLPEGLERDRRRLERFLEEVRTARKISHPNVCRVYDIGEVEGQHFLSMEYVDGEDLASLLKRIGRLPGERAVPVARQICAALAAAHEQGILHRDLKPANVMIDGQGRVRLTDFGLAGVAEEIRGADVRSGTLGYMSPEQISGEGVSLSSDIYALGLVLYELFTGRPAFSAESAAELRRLQTSTPPSSPSSHVQEIDPAVESVVLRCLEKEPDKRPQSVLAVAAALPGGDPLAAALAAGETPSPELVAEAGRREAMRPGPALLLALVGIGLFVGAARWTGGMTITHYLPLDKRPAVLIDRAGEILERLGFTEPAYSDPVDHAWGLFVWQDVIDEIAAADASPRRWDGLRERPDAGAFWYRQSPRLLIPQPSGGSPIYARRQVRLMDPAPLGAGEASVILDLDGRLRRLEVLPKRFSTREPAEPDWTPLFELAELDPARFAEVRPRYQRYFTSDLRRAWLGSRAEQPDVELRVEAGAYEGRPILFNVATASSMDSMADDPEPARPGFVDRLVQVLPPMLILVVMLLSLRLVRRNLAQGRADRRGALRFALFMFGVLVLRLALSSHVLMSGHNLGEIWPALVGGIFMGTATWSMYIAAEPLGRRVWPSMFVSTSRLLSRPRVEWRDPLIGSSVLIGIIAGTVAAVIAGPVRGLIHGWIAGEPAGLLRYDLDLLTGQREILGAILEAATSLGIWFILILTLVVIRMLVSRAWIAVGVTVAIWTLIQWDGTLEDLVFALVNSAILMAVLLRWGIVATFALNFVEVLAGFARASDWSAWHAQGAVITVVVVAGLAVYGAWAAIGGSRHPAAAVVRESRAEPG